MNIISTLLVGLLAAISLMTILWIASLMLKNSSIVDIFWGAGFVILAWVYFYLTPSGFLPRKLILAGLVTIWGLRLSLYILWRNWGKAEDFRYQAMRKKAIIRWWWQSYFQVFILQGMLMWLISTPLLAAQFSSIPNRITFQDVIGICIWIIGFFFEATGDFQLAAFKADPSNKGMVMDRGVWRFTRHPNYFGDSAQWWGFYLVAAAATGWWTIFSPIIMTILLLRISGVALLEKSLETKPGYREYVEKTSAFVPWFPPRKLK